jgi:outer membrane protein assembly factor BamB
MVSDKGVASCLEADSGQPVWVQRLGGNFSSSPIYADDRIYIGNRSGEMFVLKPGRTFDVLATNRLDSGILATPAAVGRAIYLRTEQAVYRIELPRP